MRPCWIVRKKNGKETKEKALFHIFFENEYTKAQSEIGYGKLNKVRQALAIVEFEDGHVEQVKPTSIVFADDIFDEFEWEGEEDDGREQ